ncbi:SGNH/GDSL hydrolase family protein [Streptomyces sp. NPDC048305]|uniref:SGNH/GDSL hydrolase family protein n=1 Tax=Streptomyces sp. NPDC048305 TaxID=3365532 RepID=UPI00371C8302
MPIHLSGSTRVLFQGDSITAAHRALNDADLGKGYVRHIADALAVTHPGVSVANRGVSGDRVADLSDRWATDTLATRPEVLSVLIGVNDTWRRYDRGETTSAEDYERNYRGILRRSTEQGSRLVLIEPFLLPVRAEQWSWREDLDRRIHVVRRLADEFDAALLAADGLLHQAACARGGAHVLTDDGVHLTPTGHEVLADAWLRLVEEA